MLTHVNFPARGLKLVQTVTVGGKRRMQQLLALENGTYDIEAQYELHIDAATNGISGFQFKLPTAKRPLSIA